MSEDDVLFGYRLQLVDLAGRIGVAPACRAFGIHRSTYYRWKRMIERHGLEILRPRERRRPRIPNQLSPLVEERIVAFALGHPGLGPARIASELRRERWGGLLVSHNGVWRCLRRHGLNTRQKRLSLVAGYAKHGSGLGRVRWVVERTFAWLHHFRRLLVRYDRRHEIHEAFLAIGCCLVCSRRLQNSL